MFFFFLILLAKFLYLLGLRDHPPLKTILQIASTGSAPNLRSKALKYFIDNFKEKFASEYKPHEINIPFLPCTAPGVFETPMGCFSNPECAIMKFHSLHPDLRFRAEELGVRHHPTREQLLTRLTQSPPQSEPEAREVFGYLSSQQASFNHSDWNRLASLAFIPIRDKTQSNKVIYVSPQECFFKGSEERYVYKKLPRFYSFIGFSKKKKECQNTLIIIIYLIYCDQ